MGRPFMKGCAAVEGPSCKAGWKCQQRAVMRRVVKTYRVGRLRPGNYGASESAQDDSLKSANRGREGVEAQDGACLCGRG